jgi:hypothetical protein
MQRTIPSPDLTRIHIESCSCSSRQDMIKELWCVSDRALLHITGGGDVKKSSNFWASKPEASLEKYQPKLQNSSR